MGWKRIMNRLRFGAAYKKRRDLQAEQSVREYLRNMAVELNFRLLCETADTCCEGVKIDLARGQKGAYEAKLFLPPEQVLWVEEITVTGSEITT